MDKGEWYTPQPHAPDLFRNTAMGKVATEGRSPRSVEGCAKKRTRRPRAGSARITVKVAPQALQVASFLWEKVGVRGNGHGARTSPSRVAPAP